MSVAFSRITRWSVAGAVFACIVAGSFASLHLITAAFVGLVTGAAAGAAASVSAPRLLQASFTGLVAGVCGSTLGYLLLGSSHGFWEDIGRGVLGSLAAFLILRFGISRDDQRAFAPPPRSNQAMPFRQAQGPELAEGERTTGSLTTSE